MKIFILLIGFVGFISVTGFSQNKIEKGKKYEDMTISEKEDYDKKHGVDAEQSQKKELTNSEKITMYNKQKNLEAIKEEEVEPEY